MIEFWINKKFATESSEWKKRAKLFNYTQIVSTEEFNMVNEKNTVKFENNPYYKNFNLIAN